MPRIDVRRLAAVDLHGAHGTRRRRRVITAEFVLGAVGGVALGVLAAVAGDALAPQLFGVWLAGVCLNYVPLAAYALWFRRPGRLEAELAGVDLRAELRHYTVAQFWITVPLLFVLLALRRRRGPEEDPTGWFEDLYARAQAGEATVPWARDAPNPLLAEWAAARGLAGDGRRALVVGSGLGDDAEHVARLGFATVAFDIAPTAIALARRRFPDSSVDYAVADLLDPPAAWRGAFDFVLESITVQALPPSLHPSAIRAVAALVAPGGTLLVLSAAREPDEPVDGPPWPLTRAELDGFAAAGLAPVRVEAIGNGIRRWRAEYARR